MGKVKAGSRRNSVALLACLAFAWSRLAFPATVDNSPPAAVEAVTATDSQPDAAVEFLGGTTSNEKSGSKKSDASPAADTQAKKSPFSSLRFAPIRLRVGGSVGYTISRQASGAEPAVIQESLNTNLDVYATSYIWKPWFARIEGQVLYTNSVNTSTQGGAGGDVPNSTVSGEAKLKLFPVSRYPFEATIRQSESFAGYGAGAPNSRTDMLRLSQSYTPRNGKERYSADLTRTVAGGMDLRKDREDALDFDMSSTRFAKQLHSLIGGSTRSYGSQNRILLNNRLVSRHEYKPDSDFSINGFSNVNYTRLAIAPSVLHTTSLQLNSFASWIPRDQPYNLTSSFRGFETNLTESNLFSASSRGIFADLGGSYRINQYLNLSASGNLSAVEKQGKWTRTRSLGSTQSASVNYPLPSINFGDLRYTRGINGRLSNRANTGAAPSVQSVTVSPSHALARGMRWMGGDMGLNLSQGLSLSKASRSPESASLAHRARAGWSRVDGKQVSTVSIGASDNRTLLGQKNMFQMINLQATLSTEVDRNSTWNGNLTLQTARSGDAQLMSPFISSSSANLRYKNRRMFNINRVDFTSELRITSKSLLPVLVSAKDPAELAWNNGLTYSLGRMRFSLQGNVTQAQNITNTLIMFNAVRTFGRAG